MPQSFACLYHHLIFATKTRSPLITEGVQPRLFDSIGGILRAEGCALIAAGGMPDHVHLLVSLDKQVSMSEALRIERQTPPGGSTKRSRCYPVSPGRWATAPFR